MISGRRLSHHICGVVTFAPSFSVSGSGTLGYGLALSSSMLAWLGAFSLPLGPGRRALMPSWSIMFWRSWSVVKVTGGGAVEAVLWPVAATAQAQKSEAAKDFKTGCTLASLGWYSCFAPKSDLLPAIIINLFLWRVHLKFAWALQAF